MKRKAEKYQNDSEPEMKQRRFDWNSSENGQQMANKFLYKGHEFIQEKKRKRDSFDNEEELNEHDWQKKPKINNTQANIEIPLFHRWKEVTNSIPVSQPPPSNNEENSQFNSFNFWRTPFEPILDST